MELEAEAQQSWTQTGPAGSDDGAPVSPLIRAHQSPWRQKRFRHDEYLEAQFLFVLGSTWILLKISHHLLKLQTEGCCSEYEN